MFVRLKTEGPKDSEALPVTRQPTRFTRSSSSSTIISQRCYYIPAVLLYPSSAIISQQCYYIPKRSRTVTYQRSFFIRACRTWNVLPAELRTNHISLASFNRSLHQYSSNALDMYDVDDIRTWRTICPRCIIARALSCPPSCCS